MSDLAAAVRADRLASYVRLRGGFPIPLAGAAYWAVLAYVGWTHDFKAWLVVAIWGSGMIFPLALLLARLFKVNFMGDRTSVSSVLLPTFISMFLFWPMLIAAVLTAPTLAPLILAIGMSLHWPVIGWSYGRTGLYTAHAGVRALTVFAIWVALPEARLTFLPLSVAPIYLATVAAILIDLPRMRGGAVAALAPSPVGL
jgi:hypothetical protein